MAASEQHETIEQIAEQKVLEQKARLEREQAEKLALSKVLGERALEGESIGFHAFMAIGYPYVLPETDEYRRMAKLCKDAQRIPSGKLLYVGYDDGQGVLGIKAYAGDKGLAFQIHRGGDDGYVIAAQVLCSRAIYTHAIPENANLHGTEEEPYPLEFIEVFSNGLNLVTPQPVRELFPGNRKLSTYKDRLSDGTAIPTALYTDRLIADMSAQPQA